MKKSVFTLLWVCSIIFFTHAQKNCGVSTSYKEFKASNPQLVEKLYQFDVSRDDDNTIYTIPVVVHVVWKTSIQNIPDSAIHRQIEELNRFFSGNPFYANNIPFRFKDVYSGDTKIRFELAKRDPQGNPTNGITRTQTCIEQFTYTGGNCSYSDVKKTSAGGKDAWNTDKYLNIWVCNFSINGVATLPGQCNSSTGLDGVVANYMDFSTISNSLNIYEGTNTAAHEIGHYLGLFHIWGDEPNCTNDDGINDTPLQAVNGFTYSPTNYYPIFDACSVNPGKGIMYMNLMDYNADPACMMFTNNQKTVMRNTLKPGGPRNSLVSADNTALDGADYNVDASFKIWNTGFPSNSFRTLARGKNGEIWAGSNSNGIWRYNDFDQTWQQEPTTTNHIVRHIISDSEGNVFVASSQSLYSNSGGIRRFGDAGSFSNIKIGSTADGSGINILPSRWVTSLCLDDEEDVWASCGQHVNSNGSTNEGGLAYFDNSFQPVFSYDGHYAGNSGLPATDVRCLSITKYKTSYTDADDKFLVFVDRSCNGANCSVPYLGIFNTTLGLITYEGDLTLTGVTFNTSSATPRIRSMYLDRNNRIWMAINTSQLGLYVLYPSSLPCQSYYYSFLDPNTPYPAGASINNNAITEDSDGNIWIGTTAGLIRIAGGDVFDNSKWKIYTTADGLPSNNIMGICFDANNTIWCATEAGIFRGLPCPTVRITEVENPTCVGSSHLKLDVKGGSTSSTFDWKKLNAQGNFVAYNYSPGNQDFPVINSPGTYRVEVTSNNKLCYKRDIVIKANDFFVPDVTVFNVTSCGFDVKLNNQTNLVNYSVDVYKSNSNTIVHTFNNITQNGITTLTHASILPDSNYYIKVSGSCLLDVLSTPQDIKAKSRTFKTPVCSEVKNISASNITATSAKISWQFNCSPPVKYRIQYKKSNTQNWVQQVQSTIPEILLKNLDSGTTYDVRIRSVCSNDGSSISSWESYQFTTSGCTTPDNITVSNITSNSVSISWDPINSANQYRIRYRKSINDPWIPVIVPSNNTSTTISGLQPNTVYMFQMRARCSPDNVFSTFSSIDAFQTAARLSEDEIVHDINLYPNPTSGQFNISISSEINTEVRIRIINALGQEVASMQYALEAGSNTIGITERLPAGYYNVNILNEHVNLNKGLIIQ